MSRFTDYNNNFDIRKFIFYILGYYKFFIFSIAIFILLAYLYNKTQVPVYKNSASIFINKQNKNLLSTDISFDAAFLNSNLGNEDEIVLLNSFPIVKQALSELNYEVTYYKKEQVFPILESVQNNIEVYDNIPFQVNYDGSYQQPIYCEFGLEILSDSEFRLFARGENVSLYNYIDNRYVDKIDTFLYEGTHQFDETIKNDFFSFSISKTTFFDNYQTGEKIFFKLNHLDYLTLQYKGSLLIEQPTPTSSILNISMTGTNYEKVTVFLNKLLQLYIETNLQKKNQLAQSTIRFIDNQLGEVSTDLSAVESNLEQFRSSNQVTDLSFQGQRLFDKLNALETERASFLVQKKYYNYLRESLSDSSGTVDLVAPSSMGVVDPILTDLVTQLINLYNQRNNQMESSSSSIYLRDTEMRINNLIKTILESVNSNMNTLQISINEIDYRIERLNQEISKLPSTELKLLGIQRKFDLNDAILTFLMQKRSEAQVAKASSTPDYEVVEPARDLRGNPVGPKTTLNYAIALFLSLVFPISFILLKDFLNIKVIDRRDINDIQNLPFLGNVFTNNRNSELVLANHPNSSIAESLRAVRTNFQFFSQGKSQSVITVSSSTSGEGKSFFSANLASSFAINNQRAVLLEFDLRRPQINKIFNSENMLGLSSYLINAATIDDIIQKTEFPNLDMITAGPVAPNPAELISSDRTKELIEMLKEMYDFIVIDSAPVGIISETFHLMRLSDNVVFVVRQNYSVKEMVDNTIHRLKQNNINNFSILLNDVNVRRDSYRYGYNKTYYTDDKKQGPLKRLFGGKD